MLTQLTQRLGIQPDTQSSQQQTPAVVHQRSLFPVKNRKRMKNLSPMSRGFKKTLHVNYKSYQTLSFYLISQQFAFFVFFLNRMK